MAPSEVISRGAWHRSELIAMNPGKFDWQVDVLVEHNKISAALRKEGDLSAALAEYRAGLDIAQSLADRDPDDMEWQRELLISHEWSATC